MLMRELLGGSHTCTHGYYSSIAKGHRGKPAKATRCMRQGPGRPGTSSQGFLLMKSIPPVIYCDNTCEMSPRGAQGDPVPRVFTSGWSYRHICPVHTIPDSGRGADAQHKSHCLYKQFKHREPFFSVNGENHPEIQVPRSQPKSSIASRPFYLGQQPQACSINSFCIGA